MKVIELPSTAIAAAPWNPNTMDANMRARLQRSIERFGLVAPLVVRLVGEGSYETVGGAHRLVILQEMGAPAVPCIVVEADDAEARLLSQALNRIAGEDDLGRRAALVRDLIEVIPEGDILALLPETRESLHALASLGQADIAASLYSWQQAQRSRLQHFSVQLTADQTAIVERALAAFLDEVSPGDDGNPNKRGLALVRLCEAYIALLEKQA